MKCHGTCLTNVFLPTSDFIWLMAIHVLWWFGDEQLISLSFSLGTWTCWRITGLWGSTGDFVTVWTVLKAPPSKTWTPISKIRSKSLLYKYIDIIIILIFKDCKTTKKKIKALIKKVLKIIFFRELKLPASGLEVIYVQLLNLSKFTLTFQTQFESRYVDLKVSELHVLLGRNLNVSDLSSPFITAVIFVIFPSM